MSFQLLIYFDTRQETITLEHESTTVQYDVHWNDRVGELKERACAQEGVVSDAMGLVHERMLLEADKRWWETSVFDEENPILHLQKTWYVSLLYIKI